MEHFKGLVFDMDNTAIRANAKEVEDPELIELMDGIQEDAFVAVATGRPAEHIISVIDELGLGGEHVVANGAEIYSMEEQRSVYHRHISQRSMAMILEAVVDFPDHQLYIPGQREYTGMLVREHVAIQSPAAFFRHADESVVEVVKKRLLEIGDLDVGIGPAWILPGEKVPNADELFDINIAHASATKGRALAVLFERHGINPETIIGVGDGDNDLDMLELVGHAIAMGDATPRLIERADEVVGAQSDGAFKHVVRRVRTNK